MGRTLAAPADALSSSGGSPPLERYRPLFVIGRGGMGTVEVALELGPGGFERVVALKWLLPEGASDPRRKEMFLREARLAALLAHPNVVQAFSFGELEGQLFMAMEYVEGEPLSVVLRAAREREGELAPALVAFTLAEVCDGLHAAHELRDANGDGQLLHVVHRDVSPHNVMIAYHGSVKLLDFGVAKFDAAGHETRTGEVKGKMAYMSPEQALGEKLDRRSDLFSVGAVLFECLTGTRMWGAGTDLEVMRRLALERPPRLDSAMANCPPALSDLHARLVAHDPSERPPSARAVAEELRAFARAASPPGDGPSLAALMDRLFGQEAAQRRVQLSESVAGSATIEASAAGEPSLRGRDLPPIHSASTAAVSTPVEPTPISAVQRNRFRQNSAGVLLAALGILALADLVAADTVRPREAEKSAASPVSRTLSPIAAPVTVKPPPVVVADAATVAAPSVTTPPRPPLVAGPALPTPANVRPPSRPRPTTSRPTPVTVPSPAPATAKLPDVDPTPF